VEALAIDGPVEQAGRFDAVVAQGGEESCGLPLALRDLVDEPLSPWRPRFATRIVTAWSLIELNPYGRWKAGEPNAKLAKNVR
jgi:hypothetical protein